MDLYVYKGNTFYETARKPLFRSGILDLQMHQEDKETLNAVSSFCIKSVGLLYFTQVALTNLNQVFIKSSQENASQKLDLVIYLIPLIRFFSFLIILSFFEIDVGVSIAPLTRLLQNTSSFLSSS
jgi:hypothetical protein